MNGAVIAASKMFSMAVIGGFAYVILFFVGVLVGLLIAGLLKGNSQK